MPSHIDDQPPSQILHLISRESYLPMAALINRASQSCWNGLSETVERLASISVPELPPEQTRLLPNGQPNNQSKANLDKKDALYNFANAQKADFIKLLVLLQWSKNVEEVSKTININYWLMLRRQAYWNAISSMALLKHEATGFQIPNPDLKTAAEVLSTSKVVNFPRLGYIPQRDLSDRQILRILKTLNQTLSVKLALAADLPLQLRSFRIRNGRATFNVPNEFELDVSTMGESAESPFRMVDFRFAFHPSPQIPDDLHSRIELLANTNIDRDGLKGCFDFLHELVLSYKLAEFHKQALDLSRNQWFGHMRVELIRRHLIVQYWTDRPTEKSWIEIGIASGLRKHSPVIQAPIPVLEIKWMRRSKRVDALLIRLDESVVCFEDLLRQVIAQHNTQLLDELYDKLILTPLFAKAELRLDQTISYENPEECSLTVQLSHSSDLQLKVDAVTGLIMTSPVTERSEQLQYEINRIQAVADEVVSKLLSFRCSTMETVVFAGMAGTKWQALRSFKLTQREMKSVFTGAVVRMNIFRQRQWSLVYSLAITHGTDGDIWWLLQQNTTDASKSQARYKVLRSQRIEVEQEVCSAYFDRLADYSMGLVCLQREADFLVEKQQKFELQPLPAFERRYELPEISFDLDVARPASSKQALQPSILAGVAFPSEISSSPAQNNAPQSKIKIRFGGLDSAGEKVIAIAQYENQASPAVLSYLHQSVVDADVTLDPYNHAWSLFL